MGARLWVIGSGLGVIGQQKTDGRSLTLGRWTRVKAKGGESIEHRANQYGAEGMRFAPFAFLLFLKGFGRIVIRA